MYSQYNEDDIILDCLTRHEIPEHKRVLLDIGAWDPVTFSNSRALIEREWGGVLVEPAPGPVKSLVKEYGSVRRITVVAAAVTVHGGLVELLVTDDAVSMSTASDARRIAEWEPNAGWYGRVTVPSVSVADLFIGALAQPYEFVSIDTEGTSVDIFTEITKTGARPRCVVIEHDSRFVELSQVAEAADYQLLHENGTNRIYEWKGRRE